MFLRFNVLPGLVFNSGSSNCCDEKISTKIQKNSFEVVSTEVIWEKLVFMEPWGKKILSNKLTLQE